MFISTEVAVNGFCVVSMMTDDSLGLLFSDVTKQHEDVSVKCNHSNGAYGIAASAVFHSFIKILKQQLTKRNCKCWLENTVNKVL